MPCSVLVTDLSVKGWLLLALLIVTNYPVFFVYLRLFVLYSVPGMIDSDSVAALGGHFASVALVKKLVIQVRTRTRWSQQNILNTVDCAHENET